MPSTYSVSPGGVASKDRLTFSGKRKIDFEACRPLESVTVSVIR